MTEIKDTLTYADGSLVNGQVVVSWPIFQYNGTAVAAGQQTYPIVNGVIDITLYSNINAQPSGVYYTAAYELDEGARYEEWWVVPQLPVVNIGQIRATFPPTPSLLINAMQLSSAGASAGQFLGWNGNRWVPMYVTTLNISPNTIGLDVTATAGADITVGGSPAPLGNALVLNIPDAAAAARGVLNTGAQTFAGAKTFASQATLNGGALFGASASTTTSGAVYFDGTSFHFVGSVSFGTNPITGGAGTLTHLDLSQGPISNLLPAGPLPLGQEDILLPTVAGNRCAIGVGSGGSLWLSTTTSIAAYLRPDAAWVATWLDLSPYQHPSTAGTDGTPSTSSMVVYQDANQWAGIGFDNSMRMWFRLGPNGSGVYYYLGAGGAVFPDLTVTNLTVTGSGAGISDPTTQKGDLIVRSAALPAPVTRLPAGTDGFALMADSTQALGMKWASLTQAGSVPATRQIIAGYGLAGGGDLSQDRTLQVVDDSNVQRVQVGASSAGAVISTRHRLNFMAGVNIDVTVVDDSADNAANVTIDSTATPMTTYQVNGTAVGQQPTLNLEAGSNVTLSGTNDTTNGRINILISTSGGGTATTASYAVNGTLVGSEPMLNLIAGTNVTLSGVDNTGASRVDITVESAGVVSVNGTQYSGVQTLQLVNGTLMNVTSQLVSTGVVQVAFNWADPTTQVGDLLVRAAGGMQALHIGTTGQVLTVSGGTAAWTAVVSSFNTRTGAVSLTSGDVSGVGGVLTTGTYANPAWITSLAWTKITGAPATGVSSVFGRTGAVVAVTGDYTAAQVTNAVSTAGSYADPAWITSLAYSKLTGAPTIFADPTTTKGDLIVRGAAAPATRLGVGSDNYVLIADSTQALGVRWGTNPASYWVAGSGGAIYYSSGNVGIGTTSPNYPLHVVASNATQFQNVAAFFGPNNAVGNNTMIEVGISDGTAQCAQLRFNYQGSGSSANRFDIGFYGNTSPIVSVQYGGNVGIGTSSPGYALDVNGTIRIGSAQNLIFNPAADSGVQLYPGTFVNRRSSDGSMLITSGQGGIFMTPAVGYITVLGQDGGSGGGGSAQICGGDGTHTVIIGYSKTGNYGWVQAQNSGVNFTNLALQASGGNAGIGTAAPASKLHVVGGAIMVGASGFAGSPGDLTVSREGNPPQGAIYFGNANSKYLYYDGTNFNLNCAGGTLLVNGVAIGTGGGVTSIALQANGTTFCTMSAGAGTLNISGSGQASIGYACITNGISWTVNSTSDLRVKQNVETLTGGLDAINRLRPIRAEWNGAVGKKQGERIAGVIAQEVQEVIPEAVYTFRTKMRPQDKEPSDVFGLEPVAIIAHLILAVQQLSQRIQQLEGGQIS